MRQNLRDYREVSSSGPDDRLDLEDEKEKMVLGLTPDVVIHVQCLVSVYLSLVKIKYSVCVWKKTKKNKKKTIVTISGKC